jgi:hypothetical protein
MLWERPRILSTTLTLALSVTLAACTFETEYNSSGLPANSLTATADDIFATLRAGDFDDVQSRLGCERAVDEAQHEIERV